MKAVRTIHRLNSVVRGEPEVERLFAELLVESAEAVFWRLASEQVQTECVRQSDLPAEPSEFALEQGQLVVSELAVPEL